MLARTSHSNDADLNRVVAPTSRELPKPGSTLILTMGCRFRTAQPAASNLRSVQEWPLNGLQTLAQSRGKQ